MFDFSLICTDSSPNLFGLFDTTIAPGLLFYAYLPIALLSLVAGVIFFFNTKNIPLKKSFFGLSFTFSLFIFNETLQWILVPVSLMYFTWSLSLLFQALILYFTFKFVWLTVYKNSKIPDILGLSLLLPIIIFLPTSLNLVSFNASLCEAEIGFLWTYLKLITLIFILFLTVWLFKILFNSEKKNVTQSYLIGSTLVFSTIFFAANFYGDFTNIHEVNLLGPLGMLFFVISCAYIDVRYKIFKFKTIQAQMLVVFLLFLLGSQFFLVDDFISRTLIAVTFFISVLASTYLIKSVRREVMQREQIEKLAIGLERANERLRVLDKQKSEFVSIASHQLRSPLTAIRGYVSMMSEGSFGKLPDKANEALGRIQESTVFMASSIDDFLEVSRIESGNMKYDYRDVNLNDQAKHIVDDLRADAVRRGLLLMFRSDMNGTGMVHADAGKTQQILHNLINNALKYTPKGSVTVYAHDDVKAEKMYVDIIDTGLGLSPESMTKLFGKFARAKVASSANIMGTGLGLFVAREMVRAMGGDITVKSDGEGLGSTFTIVLPLV